MFGFVWLCGWGVATAVIALAWVGSRPGRRLITGMVIGVVVGLLLWPIALWVGVGALISQRRRARAAGAADPAQLEAQRRAAAGFVRQAELANSAESAQYWHAELRRLDVQQRAARAATSRRGVSGATVMGCTVAALATLVLLGMTAPAPTPVARAADSGGQPVAPTAPATERAVVTAVVDGDTFDADVDGRVVRVGMLSIDAPELSDPEEDRRCLGPEASALLSSLIPVGSTVVLEYDEVRTDRHGQTLAGVRTEDGVLVNAEITRAGLADTVLVDGNDRFLPAVEAAQREAAQHHRGLYGIESACTLPGRTHAVTTALAGVPTAAALAADTTADELDRMAGDAARVVALAAAWRDASTAGRLGVVWDVYTPQEHERFAAEATSAWETAVRAESALRDAATSARAREAEAARAAEEQAAAARAEAARAESVRADAARADAARAEEARTAERRQETAAPKRPAPAASADTGSGRVVHPGSYCDTAGAMGVTKKGTAMRCQMDSKGKRLRWSSA